MEGRGAAGRRASYASTGSRKASSAGERGNDFLLSKEWIQMQKNTFTNWANSKLRDTDRQIEDIEVDLADGVVLVKLLEVLSHGKRVGRYNEHPNTEARMRDNIDLALRFMSEEGKISLVNIGSSDIHQGNLKLILGVLWSLVNRYQISDGRKQGNARKLLLEWVNTCLPNNNIKNLTTDWSDGSNLAALVDYCKPGLIPNHSSLDPSLRLDNLTTCMEIAEQELDVPQVLNPEDLAADNPDELSVMTYISGFCGPDSAGQRSLLEWINKRIPNSPATNFTTDWSDGQRLGALTDSVSKGRFTLANQMTHIDALQICEEAMDAAQYFFGVEKTISPEDFIKDDLNPLSRMSYLTQFQQAHSKPPTNASKCIVSNLPGRRLRASRTYSIKVDTSNASVAGELIAWGRGPVKRCLVEEVSESVYAVRFTPVGVGTICVEATHGDLHIPGSPFEFTVNDPRKVKLNRAAIANGSYQVKQPIDFRVSTQQAGEGTISAMLRGPNGEEDAEVKDLGDKTYLVHYIPTNTGRHAIIVKFNGDDIPDTPIRINIKSESVTGTPVRKPLTSAEKQETVDGAAEQQHFFDEMGEPGPISLYVNTENAGEGKLEATCVGAIVGAIPTEVIEEEPKKYVLSFLPPKSDTYTLNVKMNIEYVPSNPYDLEISDLASIIEDNESSISKVIPFEQPAQFRLSISNARPGTLNVTSRGPGRADLQVFDNKDGTYTCQLSPSIAGKYQIDTLWEEQTDASGPKFLMFSTQKSHGVSSAFQLGNESFEVGVPKQLKLNCEEVGDGILEVHSNPRTCAQVRVSSVSKTNTYQCEILPLEAGEHKIMIQYNGIHILGSPFRVQFEPRKRSAKQASTKRSSTTPKETNQEIEVGFLVSVDGPSVQQVPSNAIMEPQPLEVTVKTDQEPSNEAEYYLVVKSDEQRIQGSPFELTFGPPETDASKCKAIGDGLDSCTVDQTAKFVVDTVDAGPGELRVSIDGEGETIQPQISALNDTQKQIQYLPTKTGKCVITVSWGGHQIPNSPFTVTVPAKETPDDDPQPQVASTTDSNKEQAKEDTPTDTEQTANEETTSTAPPDTDLPEQTTGQETTIEQEATIGQENVDSSVAATPEDSQRTDNGDAQRTIEVTLEVEPDRDTAQESNDGGAHDTSYTSQSKLNDDGSLTDFFSSSLEFFSTSMEDSSRQ